MRLDKDDPRLMDYVLGELEDGEALDVAAALADVENQEARALVDELRGVADTTRRILREDSEEAGLTDAQRAEIVGQAGDLPENVVSGPSWWFLRGITARSLSAVAAVGVIVAGFFVYTAVERAQMKVSMRLLEDQALLDAYRELEWEQQRYSTIYNDGSEPKRPESAVLAKPLTEEERTALETNLQRKKLDLEKYLSIGDASALNISPESLEEARHRLQATIEESRRLREDIAARDSLSPEQLRVARQLEPSSNLQNVEVDGSIRIRGNYYESDNNIFFNGGEDHAWYESRTRVGIGMEVPEESANVDMYQSYIEQNNSWGKPVSPNQSSVQTGVSGDDSEGLLDQRTDIIEARNRLELKANLKDGLSLSYENESDDFTAAPKPQPKPDSKPEPIREEWAEYNVGNLTGQTELSELASNIPEDEATGLSLGADREVFREAWQWNAPNDKPTEIVGGPGSETYVKVAGVKPFVAVREEPLSTFSIDVDTAAYSNVRRFLSQGQLPPPDAVRVEEMINYFDYAYPQPVDGRPFAVAVMGAPAPWDPAHRLVRIGVKGKEVPQSERPPANLVFLLDVSGSMSDANKLPLVKESMKTLLAQLRPNDRVAIVTYAGNASKVLDPTPCSERGAITAAIDSLRANGGTNGGGGIQMAYDLAQASFIQGGVNRVLIATDGDFNVGVTSHGDLMSMIEARAKSGVFLTALGFGMGNLKDSTLEQLADRGNGNYAYIDNHAEARRALVDQLSGTLHTIAKDVKIQVEFNPTLVSHYRLLGYENRALAAQDFNDDTKDAGEIGAGHTVTALYEIIPVGGAPIPGVDPLKYQSTAPGVDPLRYSNEGAPAEADSIAPGPEPMPRPEPPAFQEWLTVKMRYKAPEGNESTKLEVPLTAMNSDLRETDPDFRFASAVAAFGQVLRHSGYRHASNFDRIIEMARGAADGNPDREAFVDMVITAKTLSGPR